MKRLASRSWRLFRRTPHGRYSKQLHQARTQKARQAILEQIKIAQAKKKSRRGRVRLKQQLRRSQKVQLISKDAMPAVQKKLRKKRYRNTRLRRSKRLQAKKKQ